jgi:hypothetical protein
MIETMLSFFKSIGATGYCPNLLDSSNTQMGEAEVLYTKSGGRGELKRTPAIAYFTCTEPIHVH